jgi:hypothetical protein
VVYAAKDGETALDGDGINSPFASAFVKNLTTPGLEVRRLFDLVRDDVMEATGRKQKPFSYGSISGRQDFYFVAGNANLARARLDEPSNGPHRIKTLAVKGDAAENGGIPTAPQSRLKIPDRVDQPSSSENVAPVAQRVVLYDEDPSDPKGKQYVGSVIWRTEPIKATGSQKPDIAVRADIEIPDRKFKMTMSFRRNTDSSLPASHIAELTFILPQDFSGGGVGNVPGLLMKSNEQARGTPLAGLAVKVTDGFFLVGLSNVDSDRARNSQLLKERSWFDVPLVYVNQRRAIIAIEKGSPGERAFNDAFVAWGEEYPTGSGGGVPYTPLANAAADPTGVQSALKLEYVTKGNVAEPYAGSNGGGYLVQVSSQKNEADAQASYRALLTKFPSVLGPHSSLVKRVDLGEKGVYYRAYAGPFGSSEEAVQVCNNLKSAGGVCLVQRN